MTGILLTLTSHPQCAEPRPIEIDPACTFVSYAGWHNAGTVIAKLRGAEKEPTQPWTYEHVLLIFSTNEEKGKGWVGLSGG